MLLELVESGPRTAASGDPTVLHWDAVWPWSGWEPLRLVIKAPNGAELERTVETR